ncbi:MAG: tetratricopeptide repeat protein [Polyangiaceae bacterium]|nr:tetratricopeptide repeat protein [Polyangiaceae bacterium]
MNLEQRLNYLETHHDWDGVVEALEEAVAAASEPSVKASCHLQLGRVLYSRFLQGVGALKHFQDAYKLNSSLGEALAEARGIYWQLGKLNMVQKLLELQLKGTQEPAARVGLLRELGDVLFDQGAVDRATQQYALAQKTAGSAALAEFLLDAQVGEEGWQERIAGLLRSAHESDDNSARASAFLRAARVARRFAPAEVEGILRQAYVASPTDIVVGSLWEGLLVEQERADIIAETQRSIVEQTEDDAARADAALEFGTRWALRHQNPDMAATFLTQVLRLDPSREAAFVFLRDVYGTRDGDWGHVLDLVDEAIQSASGQNFEYVLASAGRIAWRDQQDVARAQGYYARLSELDPEHPAVQAFQSEVGAAPAPVEPPCASEPSAAPVPAAAAPAVERAVAPQPVDVAEPTRAPEPEPFQSLAPVSSPSVAQEPAGPQPESTRVAELRALLQQQEETKRHEYVRTLVALGDEVRDPSEQVELYSKAADLFVSKFLNQAEAVKTYEKVLQVDPTHEQAICYLREMYEKRRDWERLIALNTAQAERMDPGAEQLAMFKQIAKLATERVKKPEVCIELWNAVLRADPDDRDALEALAQMHDRARDYEKLADVLERLVELTDDVKQKLQVLTKLGQVVGDRLKDDARAAEAYRMLLTLSPDDRRAQDQLKRRYVALGRWDDLEMFYADSGGWDEFIRVLESNEGRAESVQQRIAMLAKVAELWMTQKGKPDRAARAYEKVLQLDPENLDAAEHLIPIYSDANNARGLVNAIEVKLKHVDDSLDRLALLREAASLYEGRLNDKGRALEDFLLAFAIAPTESTSQDDVERLARQTGRWDDVVAAYRASIASAGESGDLVSANALRLRLGRVLVEETGRVEEALAEYRAVHEAEPDNVIALEALESLYRKTEHWRELLEVFTKRLELLDDPEQKKQTLFEIAHLHEARLDAPERAIETYLVVLGEDSEDVRALEALDALYRQTENWESYAEVLRRRIELDVSEDQLVDLKFRLATALHQHLSDDVGALENYREILFLNADHDGARAALEELLTHEQLRGEAAATLEAIYEAREEWERLVNALEILASSDAESSRRAELLRKIAGIAANRLHALDRAIDAQARALQEDPSDDGSLQGLEDYAEQANAWDRLASIYRGVARSVEDPVLARQYWTRLAEIQERLGRIEDAAGSYEKVLALDPLDKQALEAMDALYRRTEHWDELVSVYRRRIDLEQGGGDAETLYAEMAQVYEEKLRRPEEAIAAYREVLTIDPSSRVALGALDGLFTRQQEWPELAENLETQLTLVETDQAEVDLMLRLAALREQKMGAIEEAIEGYRQVLERDSANGEALEAVERLGQRPEYELTIADILEPLYREQGDYKKLVGVYEVQVRRADDTHRKVDLLRQVAELHADAGNDLNASFDTVSRALAVDPAQEETQEVLERLARSTGRFDDLAKVLEELGEQQKDPELASQLTMSAARVLENDVQDPERAIGLYRKVLTIDPTNLDAAQALQALFQAAERYADMSLILQRKAEILEDLDEQKAALFEAATIEEEVLERKESAIGVYLKILELDSDDLRTVDALVNLYLGMSRWEELLGVYAKKVDLTLDPEERKVILYQVGAVHERELGDVARAIDTYQRVLEIDPDDVTALGRLDVLYQTAENWQELLSILTHEAELTADAAEAVSYQYRIAELYEKRLEDVDRAVELYRDILNLQPDHGPTLDALEGIKSGEVAPLAASSVLEPIYEAVGEWMKLVSVLEVQVQFAEDRYSKVDLLHRIARLYEGSLVDHISAFDTYARAVAEDSQNEESLGSLERLGTVLERWAAVAELYDAELDKLGDEPERFVELGLRVAQIYEVQMERVDDAVARFRRVLDVDPVNQTAVGALDRLFLQTERWNELVEILAREAEIGETPDEILEFRYRLGQVYQLRLNDLPRAIEAYRDVISAAPEHEETLRALEGLFDAGQHEAEVAVILEPLYQSTSEWEKLTRVHEVQLAHTNEPTERLAMYFRIVEDAEERLLDPMMAFSVCVRALKEQPLAERVGEECERLAAVIDGGWEQLANAYADVLSAEGQETSTQTIIGKRLARVFEEELQDVPKADETYRYVLTVAPEEPDALANLDRIYSSTEQWTELASVLEQRAATLPDDQEQVELYGRLGRVYEEQLAETDNAIRAYRRIFDELDPANEDAIQALGRIYAATEQWQQLNGVYARELENAVGDVQEAEIRARIATLAADRLGRVDDAIEGWKRVLDLRGEDAEALWALADLYQRQEHWAELTDVLERHFDIAENDEDRVGILTRRARLFSEQLNRDDEALETWQRVLDIDYSNIAALRAIAEIWRTRQDARELVAALHATIDRAGPVIEPDELKAAYRELGKTYGEILEQTEDAAEAWRSLLVVDPADFEAMEELEKIYRVEERWVDVIGVKRQRAEALEEPEEKIRELLEVAELWRAQVDDFDQATSDFEKILTVDAAHDLAFETLVRLHTGAARWEQLIELYLNRLDTREEVGERSELLRRIAKVFEDKLDDKNQAFDALVNAFAEDYSDDESVGYLERMAQATQRWGELINTANAWLQEQQEPATKIRLCLRLGKWYGQDLGHPDYAQQYYAQIMQLDPNNAQVLRQMAAIHRISGQWQKVGETLTRALEIGVANDDRKAILVDLGELLDKHMGQPEQGISFYRRALEVDPLYLPALESLERIYEGQQDHAQLSEILKSKVKALKDIEQMARTKLRLGSLQETALANLEAAAGEYRGVLELDGSNVAALRGLERVSEATQDWPELVVVLERQLDVVETERERVEVLLKLAGIQEEHFFKLDAAARRLESALEIFPGEERAYVALERCYRRQKQWLDLVSAYERHIAEAANQATRIELYREIAEVHSNEVGDVERAIEAYENIVALDDTDIPALDALARLFEKQEDAPRAIDAMSRVADLTSDSEQRVDMYYRIGRAFEETLGERVEAQERLEMALDIDPTHLPSLALLRTIAIDESDWDRAARYLEQEQANTQAPKARARLLVELGKLRDEMLYQHALAVEAYQLAMQSDEDCEEAAFPLLEEYIQTERWEEAEPLAELLVRKSKGRERHEQHLLHKLLGKVTAALGKYDRAIKSYQTAHQLDLTDQETIRGIADVSYGLQDWPSALTNYQKVLTALGESEIDERTEVYYRLGCIKRAQGQSRQAVNNFEKALALNGAHEDTLAALVDLYAKNNDWKQVAAYKRQILDIRIEPEDRFVILNEIGDIWSEKEKNTAKAIETLEEALEIKPEDHVLLHKLLQLYQRASDWQRMIDALQAIAALETRDEIKARYVFTQAQLYRDKLSESDRAVELFNEALDLNPGYLEAFERINKILTKEKNWKQLERSYRKMLHRIAGKGNTDLEYNLWHQLGLVYRDRMQQTEDAMEAFGMASGAKPEEAVEHQILAELYESSERLDDAVKEQRILLQADPARMDAYHALYRLHLRRQSFDEVWCQAAALTFLGAATEEERKFYYDYRAEGMLPVKGRLTGDHWVRWLIHVDENPFVSRIFEMITPAALQAKIAQLKATGKAPVLDPRFRQDPMSSTVTFAKTFGWAAQVLGVGAPELYVRNDVPGAVVAVPALPPASVAGQTVLTGFQPRELTFICGKHLGHYRTDHYIRTLFQTQSELTIMFFAGLVLGAPTTPMPPEMAAQIRATAQQLAKFMQPVQVEHLREVVKRFIDEAAKANIKRWNQGVELTACRAGLLICGDLEIAKKIIASEPQLPGDRSPTEKMQELILFSTSSAYTELRKVLGVAVG